MITTPPDFIPPRQRHGRRRRQNESSPTPPALTLVAANYEPDGPNVNLHFDRDVDIRGIDPTAISVLDGPGGQIMVGLTASLADTNWVQVQLRRQGDYEGSDTTLTASGSNGIVAVDGGAWGGTEGTGLPFP